MGEVNKHLAAARALDEPGVPGSWQAPGAMWHWREFAIRALLSVAMPLLPLAIEACVTSDISDVTLILVAAIYPMSIGIASGNRFVLLLSVLACAFFSAAFGVVVHGDSERREEEARNRVAQPAPIEKSREEIASNDRKTVICRLLAWLSIAVIAICHIWESHYRHMIQKGPLFDLSRS